MRSLLRLGRFTWGFMDRYKLYTGPVTIDYMTMRSVMLIDYIGISDFAPVVVLSSPLFF